MSRPMKNTTFKNVQRARQNTNKVMLLQCSYAAGCFVQNKDSNYKWIRTGAEFLKIGHCEYLEEHK